MILSFRTLIGSLLVASSSGCGTISNLETARTLRKGQWQVAVEGRFIASGAEGQGETQRTVDLAVRRGMTDDFELGLRAGFGRPELFGKLRLRDGSSGGPHVALSQTLGLWRWTAGVSHWQFWSRTALPIGFSFGENELVLSPQLHVAAGRGDLGLWGLALYPTLSVGFSWRLWKWLGVMPQLSAGYPLYTVATQGPTVGGGFILEAALAFTFTTGVTP